MDVRGSVTKWTQSDGTTVLASREYDAFGNLIPNSAAGTWPSRFGYQGQTWMEILSTNGSQRLLLSPTRLYDPWIGRFLQNDPPPLNRALKHYLYAEGNPLSGVDPLGLDCVRREKLQSWWEAFWEGALGGLNIVLDTLTFGLTDWMGLTDSDRYRSDPIYNWSQALSVVAREALLAATGLKALALLGKVAQGLGRLATIVRYTQAGIATWQFGHGAYMIGAGTLRVMSGDFRGAADIAGGLLSFTGGFGGLRNSLRGFEGALSRVAQLTRNLHRGRPETMGQSFRRFFVQDTSRHPSVASSWGGRLLQRILPSARWEQGHLAIQRSWSRPGSPSQVFTQNASANFGVTRIANAGMNLLPLPARLNSYLGRSPIGTALLAAGAYGALVSETAIAGNLLHRVYSLLAQD